MFAKLLISIYVLFVTSELHLTEDVTIEVALSVVDSLLDYANSVIHVKTRVKRLQSVQNSVARAVLNRNLCYRREHSLSVVLSWQTWEQ